MALKQLKFLILLLSFPFILYAQTEGPNAWLTIDVNKELKKWDFAGEMELRSIGFFDKNQRLSLQAEGSYKICKVIEAGLSYSIMSFYDSKYNDYQWRNRYAFVLQGKGKINRFALSLREKGELTTKDESDRIKDNEEIDTYAINPELVWRNRLKAAYDIPNLPLAPSISIETFYILNDPERNEFEKIRYTFSLSYKLNKHNSLEIFSIYNKELIEGEESSYVIGAGYKLTL
ncbi:MAG: DUF2490 domain-containing protein [Chloroflexota bacterium]